MGSLLSESDDGPRIRTRDPAPTAPEESTCTPAARPESSSPVDAIAASAHLRRYVDRRDGIRISAFICVPVTVVTTSASEKAAWAS